MQRWMRRAGLQRLLVTDRRGSVAVLVGIGVVGLVGMFTIAIEVTSAVAAHARLRQAADTAALAAVRQAAIDTSTNADASLTPAIAAGTERFLSQAGTIARVAVSQPIVTVKKSGLTITAVVTFNASYATQIAGALGGISSGYASVVSIPLGGTAAARQQVGAHLDLQVLMDVSNSMTIGSTSAAQAALQQDTATYPVKTVGPHQNGGFWWIEVIKDQPDPNKNQPGWGNCAFACHLTTHDGWGQQYGDYYQMAKQLGVQLRIDLLRNAASQIAAAMASAPNAQNFQFSLNTFDRDQRVVYPLGSPAGAPGAIADIDVTAIDIYGYNQAADYTQTNVAPSITSFASTVSIAGDGSSRQSAQRDVVLMTDGVEDTQNGRRQTGTFDPKACDDLKNKGIRVFVLHAVSKENFVADDGKDPAVIFAALVASMTKCASTPTDYFLASSPADVLAATNQIINLALAKPTVLTLAPSTVHQEDD